MKKTFTTFLFIAVFSFSHAQTPSTYLAHSWKGYFQENSENFEGDSYTMTYTMYNVSVDDTYWTFSATMTGTINIDGYNYSSTWAITGSVTSDYTVSLNYSYTISADQLPGDLYWIYENLTGTLYEDSDFPGDYIIHGYKYATSGEFELVTHY